MSVIGTKQNKAWFIAGSGRPLNARGMTVDFQNQGEPDTEVFRNQIESSLQKRAAADFQDQATFTDVNNRVNIDKFTTPDNLPVVDNGTTGISINVVAAANETTPYTTYAVSIDKSTYADVLAGESDTVLTPDNYPIVSASSDPGNVATVTPVQNGNAVEYIIEVTSLPLASLIIDITYNNLVTAIGTSTLKPGFWYKFPYQCIHQIPYTNVLNTSSSLTIPTENLLVQAISSNSLDRTNVRSLEHPQDIIHWRWEDNKVVTPTNEDPLFTSLYIDTVNNGMNPASFAKGSITFVGPTVNRAGRIYYREDTIQRISTPYDFRGVVLRRWGLKKDGSGNYVFKNALTYTPATLYKFHDVILDAGINWLVVYPFTATASIGNHTYNMVNLNNMVAAAAGNTPQFIATNSTTYVLFDTDNQYFTSTKVEIDVDAAFEDHFTFYNAAGTLQAFNVQVKDYIPAWIEAVTWEFYPNIVFGTHLGGGITPITNVTIDNFSYDITLYNVTSIAISSYCRDIFINGRANGNIGDILIERNNQFLHIDQQSVGGESITVKRLINKVGLGNRGLLLLGGSYDIGNNNNRFVSYGTSNIVLGDTTYVATIVGGSHKIEDFNSFICLHSCVNNSMGNRNRNVFNILGTNTKFGDYNVDVSSLKPNVVEGVGVPHSNNTVGDYNSLITVSGTGNYYNRVFSVIIPDGVTVTSCSFENLAGVFISNSGAGYSFTRSSIKDINNTIGIVDCNITDSIIYKTPSLSLNTVNLVNTDISTCNNLSILRAAISSTTFKNVNTASITLAAGSTIVYSKFEKVSSMNITYLVQAIIGYLQIINNSTINLTSTLSTGVANVIINHVTIDNTSNINILELNNTLSKVFISNSAGLSIYYGNLTNCNFITTVNLDLGSNIPLSLTPANAKVTISDTTFEEVNGIQVLHTTNTGGSITNSVFNIVSSKFSNFSNCLIYVLSQASKTNQINACTFSNVSGVNFGSVPLDVLAVDAMTYYSSVFENINITGGALEMSTPKISVSSIKNVPSGVNAGICYRISLVECIFEGFIRIQEVTVTPDYSFRNVLTKFRGGGWYKKSTNASVNTTGYSIDNRLLLAKGLPLDTMPSNASDIDYKATDGTVICGIQNVVTASNIVLTPVNITLI